MQPIKCYNNDNLLLFADTEFLRNGRVANVRILNWQFQFEGWWKRAYFNCSELTTAFYFYKLISFQMGSNQLLKVLKIKYLEVAARTWLTEY